MIGHIFDQQGHLPTTWADICATSVDILLRQWDKQRGVEFASSQREVRVLLSDLALWMTTNEQNSCRLQDWSKSVIASGSYEDLRPFLELAERSGVVTHSSTDSVQFVHASIQEYLAAIALTDRPIHQAAGIASEFHLVETLAAVTPNADELVTEFVNDGKFTEAISVATKSQNGETKHRLLQEIAERMGLAGTIPPMITGSSFGDGVPWNRLKELWKKCDTAESKHEKGLALEDFSETFFGLVFQVVEKRLATDAGEVDLLCEHKQLDAFWIRWQSDVFVECKNQIDRSPVSDVNTFLGKCATCRSKLSFFVSRSGFTSVATTALGRSWGNRDLPDTVWIGGNDIERLLDEQSDPEDFLKIMCRRSNYGRG
ncbi:hypothetical protein LOC67_20185 [Stieleria sp. JC731]|uniref:NACHT domain-containing protein n=1 Tax=Pirellulaceae TaxID=2691357 RepID=UPI001E3041BC|nr:hypothetical protein [Stieleria sp. JC731]MCC9602875.1 hypothetical protein [Stieleria sp. JC731]